MRPARLLLPAALATAIGAWPLAAAAQATYSPWSAATSPGPYVLGAVGASGYDADCDGAYSCSSANADGGKFAFGWRFGVFGLEGAYVDYGRARLRATDETLQLRSLGMSAVWHLNFGPYVGGQLRTGLANVEHRRTFDGTRNTLSATFGLGLVVDLAPQVGLDLGWDVTAGEGRFSGTAVGSMVSAGLRIAF